MVPATVARCPDTARAAADTPRHTPLILRRAVAIPTKSRDAAAALQWPSVQFSRSCQD